MSIFLFVPLSPSDLIKIIQVVGGSSAILYALISNTRVEREFCFFSFFFSNLCCFLFIETFSLTMLLIFFFLTLIFLPRDWVFLLVLIGRCFALEGGFALLMQIAFLYLLKKESRINLTFSLTFSILSLYYLISLFVPLEIFLKSLLFPLSGAFAIFFLYIARSGIEHFLSFLVYFLNGLFLCFLFSNIEF